MDLTFFFSRMKIFFRNACDAHRCLWIYEQITNLLGRRSENKTRVDSQSHYFIWIKLFMGIKIVWKHHTITNAIANDFEQLDATLKNYLFCHSGQIQVFQELKIGTAELLQHEVIQIHYHKCSRSNCTNNKKKNNTTAKIINYIRKNTNFQFSFK